MLGNLFSLSPRIYQHPLLLLLWHLQLGFNAEEKTCGMACKDLHHFARRCLGCIGNQFALQLKGHKSSAHRIQLSQLGASPTTSKPSCHWSLLRWRDLITPKVPRAKSNCW